jgi:cbb3-type cytochrome oxidase subunit 3
MNPVWQAAGQTAQLGWIMGVMTAVFLVVFTGWIWWAYSRRNAANMEAASRMPFDGADE